MRITESRLRRIIRSVIRESTIYHPEHGPLQQMPDGSYLPDDIARQMYSQSSKTKKSKKLNSEEEALNDVPPQYIENPNPEYDLGGMPIRSQIKNPAYIEYMERKNKNES